MQIAGQVTQFRDMGVNLPWAPAWESVIDTDFEQVSVVILGDAPGIAPRVVFVTQPRSANSGDGQVSQCCQLTRPPDARVGAQ